MIRDIPEQWDEKKLRELCMSKGEYGINAPAVKYSKDLHTYLRITDINEDGAFIEKGKKSVAYVNAGNFILREGDIVFARTGASVGKTYLYNKADGILVFAGFLIKFTPNEKILLSQYLKFYTSTKQYWD